MSIYSKMYSSPKQTVIIEESISKEETNKDAIKIRLVLNVAFKNKDIAKIAKLNWNPNYKYWYYDKIFSNTNEFKEFIEDDEKEFNFPVDSIFNFSLLKFDDDNDFEGDEYEKIFEKYFKFQNIYFKLKSEKNSKKENTRHKITYLI